MRSLVPPKLFSKILFALAFLGIALFAFVLRIYDIEARPLHSDEAVNFLFYEGMNREGVYHYSHENYHGPLYFFAQWLGIKAVGDSVLGLRTASISFGILCLLPLLIFRHTLGRRFVLISALLFCLAPSFVFHSRYSIHEMLLVASSCWFAAAAFDLLVRGSRYSAAGMVAALGVMISTKETWVITGAAVFFAVIFAGNTSPSIQKFWHRWKPSFFLSRLAQARQPLFLGYLVALLVVILSFTNGLAYGDGLREMFLAIPQWVGRGHGDRGHFKPWQYYIVKLLWPLEPHLIIGFALSPLLAIPILLWRRNQPERSTESTPRSASSLQLAALRFFFLWSAFITAVYSYVPYKTPWLIINLSLPLLLLLAWAIDQLFQFRNAATSALGVLALFASLFVSVKNTSQYCYALPVMLPDNVLGIQTHTPFGPGNPYSYVHTSPGMLQLIGDLFQYWETHPNARVLIGVEGYFPLPYYLRSKHTKLAYLKTTDPGAWKAQYDVIIVSHTVNYADPSFEKRYYRLSDYAESNTYFKK